MAMEKIALVTGSSRGIGRAIARELAREGWKVCINYRVRRDCAESLLEEISAFGGEAMIYGADVSRREEVNAMVAAVKENWGAVSLLINNAGVAGQALFQDVTDELWHRYFSVNVDGAFHAIQAVLPPMLREHTGCIINVSSMWGLRGASCEVTYSCTKAALIAMSRSLALELAPTNIRVNCIAPGVIKTDMLDALPAEVLPQLAEETPLRRLGTPEDIAHLAVFLASDKSSFITGQVITADGGFIV
ncbi:MAG: glucose 1-dehydrogenase [Oscillospiraceae bacterium]|nr:glucose 1-dehydrogenase [Oscillospiraceae bacterium]